MIKIVPLFVLFFVTTFAWADQNEPSGVVEAEIAGKRVAFSALTSHYQVEVRGDAVNVRLTQTFANPLDVPVNARYLFPLNRTAAVHAMTMRVGDEVVEAVIQKRAQAQKTFQAAKKAGKAASLLTQHRPNMFTQRIANLMPGLPIEVTIEYSQMVPKIDGARELVIPMVVGPRYQPAGAGKPSAAEAQDDGSWQLEQLPAYAPTAGVDVPDQIVGERVSLDLELEASLPLLHVQSDTHPLSIRHRSSTQANLQFKQGKVLDNKDFVLRWSVRTKTPDAGVLTHWEPGEGGYFSLLIEPPMNVAADQILPREMVFLLDCSGSMSGLPMDASKRFMRAAMKGLRPTDTFRVIRFSDSATEFSSAPVLATPENIERGLAYVASLYGSGGTEMMSGIRQALWGEIEPGRVRNVVFLTDGYIGNEHSILEYVEKHMQTGRLFAFGVGTGVNRYLLSELGRVGRGFTRYFDPTKHEETAASVAQELADRLQSPVLTDLSIDWGDLPVSNVLPSELPDLYAGDTVRVTGKFTGDAQGKIEITGRGAERAARLVKPVALDNHGQRPVVRRVWARTAVADLNHLFITPKALRPGNVTNVELQESITTLGLDFGLVTRWTSFVAVSRKVYNPDPDAAVDTDVALKKVAGVSSKAYGAAPVAHAAPEPSLLGSLAVAFGIFAFFHYRRQRLAGAS